MARHVFGNPITNNTLKAMSEYEEKEITRQDRAYVALQMRNVEGKYESAQEYLEKLKKQWGIRDATSCLIYNPTGDTITFVREHSWHGDTATGPYPIEIANGQWVGFIHVKEDQAFGVSTGAVVYRGLNNDGVKCYWMAAWYTCRPLEMKMAYTKIHEEANYDTHDYWEDIFRSLMNSGLISKDIGNKFLSNVTIENDTSPIFKGIFTLNKT